MCFGLSNSAGLRFSLIRAIAIGQDGAKCHAAYGVLGLVAAFRQFNNLAPKGDGYTY